jgi:hypothetical protein
MLALAFQALLPSGYMFAANATHGGLEVVLCTSSGNITAIMMPDGQLVAKQAGQDEPSDQGHSDKAPCGFAAYSAAAYLPFALTIQKPTPPAKDQIALASTNPIAPGLGLAAPPPPKTGPPLQA